ncbi:hydroxyproline-rich glycoprotein family protein, partial [Thalictrum thalictroides]
MKELIDELMTRVPAMKELIDYYCGPDTVTAKQQQQELERVAKTLPENVPSSVKRFTDRAVLSLQSWQPYKTEGSRNTTDSDCWSKGKGVGENDNSGWGSAAIQNTDTWGKGKSNAGKECGVAT